MTDPRVMANIAREIDTVLGADKSKISNEILMHELPYTKAVFHETMRLNPPLPKNVRQAVADDVLPDGTRVYAGELIGYSNWSMGRNKSVWGLDAEFFVLERWLPESQFKFISINAGPRLCLGTTFAMLEVLETTCLLL
ncbi:MAG: cytochrome P450 [Podila humilis]|nr:MAG: cytochrome P450 [Podila humilis]